ncbi:MAG: hypothetical protein IAE90_10940 [Ignavibacteria bacterium]|nr:hypothetical protein [Ignavibacteria bacterium]
MILPYIDIPEPKQIEKTAGKNLSSTFSPDQSTGSITNDTFLYGGGMIDHPVLDFQFAANPHININAADSIANSIIERTEADMIKGNFEEKYVMISEKIEKERFARELLAGNG